MKRAKTKLANWSKTERICLRKLREANANDDQIMECVLGPRRSFLSVDNAA